MLRRPRRRPPTRSPPWRRPRPRSPSSMRRPAPRRAPRRARRRPPRTSCGRRRRPRARGSRDRPRRRVRHLDDLDHRAAVLSARARLPTFLDRAEELLHLRRVHRLRAVLVVLVRLLTREDPRVAIRALDLGLGLEALFVRFPPSRLFV